MEASFRLAFTFLFIWICYSQAFTQLVNIESRRLQTDSVRFALKNDVLFRYASNNGNEIYNLNSNITTQFKSKDLKKIWFLLGSYSLIRSGNQDFENDWMIHFRYNQKLTQLWRLEAFVQSQENRLLTIDSRSLIGGGLRLKIASWAAFRAYLGNSYMYEIENSSKVEFSAYNHRHSSYLSMTYTHPSRAWNLTNTVYFQPLYRELANYRLLEQLKIEIPVNRFLSFSGLLNYFYMSQTPLDRSDESVNIRFGITLDL